MSAAIERVAINVHVPSTPIGNITDRNILTNGLAIVYYSATMMVLYTSLRVQLNTRTVAPNVSTNDRLIRSILRLVLIISILKGRNRIRRDSRSRIVIVLIIGEIAGVIQLIIYHVVSTVRVILRILMNTMFINVIRNDRRTGYSSTRRPILIRTNHRFRITRELLILSRPVVVRSITRRQDDVVTRQFSINVRLQVRNYLSTPVRISRTVIRP